MILLWVKNKMIWSLWNKNSNGGDCHIVISWWGVVEALASKHANRHIYSIDDARYFLLTFKIDFSVGKVDTTYFFVDFQSLTLVLVRSMVHTLCWLLNLDFIVDLVYSTHLLTFERLTLALIWSMITNFYWISNFDFIVVQLMLLIMLTFWSLTLVSVPPMLRTFVGFLH